MPKNHTPLPPQQGDSSECTQQDGRKKKTAKRLCDKRDRAITCMFCHDLQLHLCFLVFYKKVCLKESEVWQKVISNKIIAVNACHTRFPVLLRKFTWLNKNLCVIVSVYDNLLLSTSVLCNLNYYENVELTGWYKTPN